MHVHHSWGKKPWNTMSGQTPLGVFLNILPDQISREKRFHAWLSRACFSPYNYVSVNCLDDRVTMQNTRRMSFSTRKYRVITDKRFDVATRGKEFVARKFGDWPKIIFRPIDSKYKHKMARFKIATSFSKSAGNLPNVIIYQTINDRFLKSTLKKRKLLSSFH